jgi:hypothetical protein
VSAIANFCRKAFEGMPIEWFAGNGCYRLDDDGTTEFLVSVKAIRHTEHVVGFSVSVKTGEGAELDSAAFHMQEYYDKDTIGIWNDARTEIVWKKAPVDQRLVDDIIAYCNYVMNQEGE